jgi:C1A family cysteine protease
LISLPASVDLSISGFAMPVPDQGQTSECTGEAGRDFSGFIFARAQKPFVPSASGIYYQERTIEGDPQSDEGADIETLFTVLSDGILSAADYPDNPANIFTAPTPQALANATQRRVLDPSSVLQSEYNIKFALASKLPVVFGIEVYESFEGDLTAHTGVVTIPSNHEQYYGRHCIVLMGYDDAKQQFKVENSWGAGWGDHGYCYFPYQYILSNQLAFDFHTGSQVS